MNNNRLHYLDSLRGIAAILVVVYHFIGWKWADKLSFKLASILFNGSDAVSFFFVLSGFVLTFKYFNKEGDIKMTDYIYKRILRLYPPYLFTLLLNFLYWNRKALKTINFDEFYSNNILYELLMIRNNHIHYIPGWTLGVEMAISLLIPFVIIIGRTNIKMMWWFLIITLIIGPYISSFVFHFTLGAIIAYYYKYIVAYDFKKSKFYRFRYFLFLLILVLHSLRHLDRVFTFGDKYHEITKLLNIEFFTLSAISSGLIIVICINQIKIQKILNHKILVFLGEISYGIYLMHWLIVVFVMDKWDYLNSFFVNKYLGFSVILFFTLLFSILTAWFVYRFIEIPFIKLGKKGVSFWLKKNNEV